MILPDLILCDTNLHGANGVETCRRIQQNPVLSDVTLMFLSSAQIPDIIRRNDGNGGSYYLRKPFDPQVLNQKGSLYLTRPTLVHYTASDDELQRRAAEVLGWVSDGSLNLRIEREVPLGEAAEAHRLLESRETKGKLVLVPGA